MRTINEIWADMQALMDGAPGRALTEEELAQYEAFEVEARDVQNTEQARARHSAYATVVVPAGVPSPAPRPEETIEDAFRAYLRSAKPNDDIAGLRVGGPEDIGTVRPAMAQGTDQGPAGGYLVPEGFRTKLVERMKSVGGLAEVAEQLVTETGNNLPWPVIDDTANVGEIVDENAAPTGGADLVFSIQDLGAWEYQAGGINGEPLKLPWALMQDSAFDIEGMLARLLGVRLARAYAPHLITGTGVKQPKGILHGLTGTAASAALPKYNDLVDLVTGIDKMYWPGARWLLSQLGLGRVWKILDSHGDPIWRPGLQGDGLNSGTLMGYPVTLDNGMPDFLVTGGSTTNWVVFGDLSQGYVTRKVRDIAIVVNPWSSSNKRQNEYTAWMRFDGRPQDTFAYKAGAGFP